MANSGSGYWKRINGGPVTRRAVLRSAAVGGVGIAGAALIGCSGGSDSKPAAQKAPAGAAGAVKLGGRITSSVQNDLPELDMHAITTSSVNNVLQPVYNQVVQFDPAKPLEPGDAIIPDLATQWEVAPDGMTYSFKLVKNAKFHDGTPLTAEDVVSSFNRQKFAKDYGVQALRQSMLAGISKFEAPDPSTFVMKLVRPMSPLSLLPIIGQGYMSIYAKKDIEGKFNFKSKTNGSGPFRLKESIPGTRIALEKNKDYHEAGRPYVDGLDFYIVPEKSTLNAQLQSGAIHYTPNVGPEDQDALRKAMGDKAHFPELPSLSIVIAAINATRAPWNDARVREAISLVINKRDAVQLLKNGKGDVSGYFVPGGLWALTPEELAPIPGYKPYTEADLVKAKALISAAGVADGFSFPILTKKDVEDEAESLFVSNQLGTKLGWKVSLEIVDTATQVDRLAKRNFMLCTKHGASGLDDPDAVFAQFYLAAASQNYSGLSNKTVEELYVKQSVEQDTKARIAMVKEMQKLSMQDMGQVITVRGRKHGVLNKVLQNYTLHASNSNNSRMLEAWLAT